MQSVFGEYQEGKTYWVEGDNEYIPFVPNIENYKGIYDNKNWITVDGRVLAIKNMTITHLLNCMKMIKRNCNRRQDVNKYKVYNNLLDEYCIKKGKPYLTLDALDNKELLNKTRR